MATIPPTLVFVSQIVKKWRAPESVLRHKQEELEGPQPENGFQNLLQSVLGATNISQTIQDAVQEKEAQKAAEISQKGQKGKSLELEFPALNETPGTKDGNASDLKVPSKAISQPLQPFALTLDDIPETQQVNFGFQGPSFLLWTLYLEFIPFVKLEFMCWTP